MVFAVAALLMVTATPSEAVHAGSGELTCGQCHTMHSSQGGDATDMGGANGSSILLRIPGTKQISDLCLSCHAENGDNANIPYNSGAWLTRAPKVLKTTAVWTSASSDFSTIGAGGDFSSILSNPGSGVYSPTGTDASVTGLASLGYGHSINNANALLPPGQTGATTITDFACTNCHDPHGVTATTTAINEYRNLKSGLGDDGVVWTAGGGGDLAGSHVGGVAGTAQTGETPGGAANIWPVYSAAGGTFQNRYFTNAGDSNMSLFCAQCHGKWHEDITLGNGDEATDGSDWSRHPVDAALVGLTPADELSAGGASIVDFDHYDKTYGGLAIGSKLPALQTAAAGTTYFADGPTDKVFCLSCHFAHAGPNFDALRWAYQLSVSTGTQVGVSLVSDVGCQQCHNRGGNYGN